MTRKSLLQPGIVAAILAPASGPRIANLLEAHPMIGVEGALGALDSTKPAFSGSPAPPLSEVVSGRPGPLALARRC